ncbi:MAG: cytosine-specific methyltransferase [Candidatus Tyloplasma litorale]|nr:MAG: cytosine-specific methyltransferase [Mycoplasmatales bacterium]
MVFFYIVYNKDTMKKYYIFETFSGIGAQHAALSNLKNEKKLDFEIIGTSDWDVFAVQSYSSIHYKKIKNKNFSDQEINNFFKENTLSLDGKKPYLNFLNRFSKETLNNIYYSFLISNNIGSIVDSFEKIKNQIIEKKGKIDILTYSFPCQDLSSAGNFHGFNEGIKSHTRSGLIYEIEKILNQLKFYKLFNNKVIQLNQKEKKLIIENENIRLINNRKKNPTPKNLLPKFLLLENVINLVQKQHKNDFDKWLKELNKIGYKTIWGIVNSNDFGLLQNRKRIFALSIYDPDNKYDELKNIDPNLSKYLKEIFNKEYKPKEIQKIKDVFDFENKYIKESKLSQIKKTPSREKIVKLGLKINYKHKGKISTVTTKQDRWPNVGWIEFKNDRKDSKGIEYLNKRFVTPRESYKLMGFNNDQYELAQKEMNKFCVSEINAREKLNKQAGNSITVNSLEMIFYLLDKIEKRKFKNGN